ncbi:MAG: metal ABC transporter permease [Clostridia bacterium]
MIEKLTMYFQHQFVINAFIVGILVALCSALLGVTLVLKRFSYIGDGLSHVAFGAMAVASVANFTNSMPFILIITSISAVILLCGGQNTKIKGDASIAMMSVGTLAVGYLILNIFSTSANLAGDVCTTLFGSASILTLSTSDVNFCLMLSLVVVSIFILFYNKIFSVTFDETFSVATGMNVTFYNLVIAIITAGVIVIAMRLVGSLLITALMVFPAISSMRVFKSFKSVIISSAIFGVFGVLVGLVISILEGTPVGSTVVAVDIVLFFIFTFIAKIKNKA